MSGDYDADVIVIGGGIVGAFVAERIALRGKSVMILEAGPRTSRWKMLQAFRTGANKNDFNAFYPELPHAPKSSGGRYSDQYIENVGPMKWLPSYIRLVGGTTWHWSAAFWRMLPNDFRMKSVYGVGRDWPLGYDELEPWYTLAEQLTGCAGSDEDDQSGQGVGPFPPRSAPYPLPAEQWSDYTRAIAGAFSQIGFRFIDEPNLRATRPYDGRPACAGNNNCSPICPIGAMYSGDMAIDRAERAGVKVVPDTVVHRLEKGAGGRIEAVHSMAPDGTLGRRRARAVVLAAHTIETPKLLLMSEAANRSDQVGRNLMTHPSLAFEGLARDELWPGQGPVQQGTANELRDGAHRREHSAIRYFSNNRAPNAMVTRRLLQQGIIGRELDERIRHDSARYVNVLAGAENLPDPANRIDLGSRRDSLGLPTPRIHMDISDYTRRAGPRVAADFAALDRALAMQERFGDRTTFRLPAHPMGSTIMGDDPATSVVDRDCRSHDHANLFIAGASVFASASTVNPTLTAVALGLRLGEMLAGEV
ncbi:GMC family oxidoreductase [Novosphingobium flavum]|uniref:GMC family oxidoreductase n=1 Tax=Novosphingobium flavum TaxID=1778672 RepID=A0A7X1FR72_9SPHN|nr:GMC family oxidoreductase [Novosphingobium flavum]